MIDPDDELGQGFDEGELFEFRLDPAARPDEALDATHRGAFGEHGGASSAFIERTFRERIVLVGVATGRRIARRRRSRRSTSSPLLVDTAGADAVARVVQRRDTPRPGHLHRQGQGRGAARAVAEAIDCRHRRVRRRADARRSSATSRSCSAAPPSTAPR